MATPREKLGNMQYNPESMDHYSCEERDKYMHALESASALQDIRPLAEFLALL
jgi:hypothetical protein